MSPRRKIRLGDLLVEHQVISAEQLQQALTEQKKYGRKLGQTLVDLGHIGESELLNFLAQQLNVPVVDLRHYQFDPEIVRKLPETHARRFRAIVLEDKNSEYLIGMADPTDIFAYDEISKHLHKPIKLAVVREAELVRTFDLVYRRTEQISHLAEELGQELSESDFDLDQMIERDDVVDAPVVKLLQSVFEDAVQMHASDIHIEPDEKVLRIRQRIDGMLHEQEMKETRIAPALVLRLKLMAGLDISEKRMPQDGRFHIRVKQHNVDVRLSTMPVQHGESVVMRLLDQSGGVLELDHLGMPANLVEKFRKNITRPHGLVLVTGPTGSGKTTTLYAALSELNQSNVKIITTEDPVEYRLPRINQVQINNKIGLTFPVVLRTALRQDPDVILVGEMRDQETVQIGLRAAMTGHMVLSTLHTNDAISTADRLLDMGAEGFLLASALRAIVAQRLLRRVCKSCSEAHQLSQQERSWVAVLDEQQLVGKNYQHGKGCPYCNNTGYNGRIGVYEILEPDASMLRALRQNDQEGFIQAAKSSKSYKPLSLSGLELAAQGVTSIQEVMRIANELDGDLPEYRPAHIDAEDSQHATV